MEIMQENSETKKHIGEEEEEEEDHVHAETQKEEDKLRSAKAKVGEIREENERLKLILARKVKDYQSLHTHFLNINVQQEEAKKSTDTSSTHHHQENKELELLSLSLGRSANSSEPNKNDIEKKNSNLSNGKLKEGLALGLDCRFELNSTESEKNPSSENTSDEQVKEEEPAQLWPPSKVMKSMRNDQDEEVIQQAQLKRARVSVRARCNTTTMNDGCQWRKYGQKIAKGNPCPRAYYRCTVSPNCPVRKQVQRWVEDMSILITTYEGTHNHPLPFSATAMASTTSAAASMLQCHSSTSQPGLGTSVSASNFTNFPETTRPPHQLYFPNYPSITNSNSHPTIVLDLTTPASLSHFNRLSSAPRYDYDSSTCLNFSSASSTSSLEPSGFSNYANHIGKQPYMQMNNPTPPQVQSLTETIAATTKVITSNPNFQSALAAAISSYISNGGSKSQQNLGGDQSSGLDMKWGKSNFPIKPAESLGLASSFLNKLPSSTATTQQPAPVFPFNSLPFSMPKNASGSPVDVKDHAKL